MITILLFLALRALHPQQSTCGDREAIGRVAEMALIDDAPIQVRRAGESVWVRVEEGAIICEGDQIRTRFRSRARLHIASGGIEGRLDVTLGVNARVRTIGSWGALPADTVDVPTLDIVHGVVSIVAEDAIGDAPNRVRTGPTTCRFGRIEVLSNWDPFKREANHIVESGQLQCTVQDSTFVVDAGRHVELIDGYPEPVQDTQQLIHQVFSEAVRLE